MKFSVNEANMKITGRTLDAEGVRYLGYSGASVSFRFVGTKAFARIRSDASAWPDSLKGWVAVYVNDEAEPAKRFRLDADDAVYPLYESGEGREVTLTLIKYSEAAFGLCGIVYLETDSDALLAPPSAKARRIEIIGDSITCGYGVEAEDGAVPFSTATENPAKSYSMLTASALNAEVNLVSWSGNGIISKFVPEDAEAPLDDDLMPVLYPYTDLSCCKRLWGQQEQQWEKWDFSRFVPDMILINLGTNDCSWCKDIQERKERYKKEYGNFLRCVRANNPHSEILCMLGTMDQRVLKELEEAVRLFRDEQQDAKVHFLALPLQNPADGYGADYHPCPKTHRMTADIVAGEVRKIMGWES